MIQRSDSQYLGQCFQFPAEFSLLLRQRISIFSPLPHVGLTVPTFHRFGHISLPAVYLFQHASFPAHLSAIPYLQLSTLLGQRDDILLCIVVSCFFVVTCISLCVANCINIFISSNIPIFYFWTLIRWKGWMSLHRGCLGLNLQSPHAIPTLEAARGHLVYWIGEKEWEREEQINVKWHTINTYAQ